MLQCKLKTCWCFFKLIDLMDPEFCLNNLKVEADLHLNYNARRSLIYSN